MKTENGRSMVEMLGVLSIMGVLSTVSVWGYSQAINNHKANLILNELNQQIHLCSAQLVMQNKDVCDLTDFKNNNLWPMSVKKIDADFFKMIVSQVPQKVCRQILNKGMALASFISPNDCDETNQIEFLFHKTLNPQIQPKKCASDTDCDICGTCSADGYCQNECLIPLPDEQNNCGENECIVYNEESQSCQNACEQVTYLQATGTQYIDTGYMPTSTTLKYETHVYTPDMPTLEQDIIGYYVANMGANLVGLYQKYVFNYTKEPPNTGDVNTTSATFSAANDFYISAEANGDTLIKSLTVNGVTKTGTLRAEQTDFSNILLFRGNPSVNNYVGKMYYCKIYDNNNLVRDLIPVIDWDMTPCMFDKVSKKLFKNSGMGSFKTNLDE